MYVYYYTIIMKTKSMSSKICSILSPRRRKKKIVCPVINAYKYSIRCVLELLELFNNPESTPTIMESYHFQIQHQLQSAEVALAIILKKNNITLYQKNRYDGWFQYVNFLANTNLPPEYISGKAIKYRKVLSKHDTFFK